DGIDHLEDALDLAAEVGVAGRIDDVDARPLPGDRRELRQDGDAALALEVVRVHRAVRDHLARAELARLAQEAVDQRRLAVIDVGDDGDVADVWAGRGHFGGGKVYLAGGGGASPRKACGRIP